nr:MAG TPA_asm: hypothetical protein [Caudoviricetes sp.]
MKLFFVAAFSIKSEFKAPSVWVSEIATKTSILELKNLPALMLVPVLIR